MSEHWLEPDYGSRNKHATIVKSATMATGRLRGGWETHHRWAPMLDGVLIFGIVGRVYDSDNELRLLIVI